MISVTRRYRLPAAHVLTQPEFGDAENRRIFGKCANPAGHGHDYEFEVTVTGPVDAESGQIIAPELLDEIFEDAVRSRYSHTLLNECEAFAELVPTAENIARVCFEGLQAGVTRRSGARLSSLRVIETGRNEVVYGDVS